MWFDPSCGFSIAEYAYDPFGRRIEKKVVGGEGTSITRYLYDNEDILYTYDADGNVANRFIHGPGIDEPLAVIQGKETYYYHADGLGSVVALTDDRGRVVQDYEYDSYGNLHDLKNRVKQHYSYTSREWSKEIGLYFYRARYYDPMEGRFISRDPIGFKGGINQYQYSKGNPISLSDPTGLSPLITEAIKMIIDEVAGDIYLTGLGSQYIIGGAAECASGYCEQRRTPKTTLDTLNRCQSIFSRHGYPAGIPPYDSMGFWSGCSDLCFKITKHPKFKINCCCED